MTQFDQDIKFMRAALDEAQQAFDTDEIPIGAVVVCQGRIIGRGHNLTEMLNDVTAHAEMQAITAAANTLGGKISTRLHPICYSRAMHDVCWSHWVESTITHRLWCWRRQTRILGIYTSPPFPPQGNNHPWCACR